MGETYISYTEEFTKKLLVSYLNKKLNEVGKNIKLKIKFILNAKSKILVSFQKNTKSDLIPKKDAKKAKPAPKGISNNLKKNKSDESEMDNNTLMKNKPSSLVDESEMLNDEPILVNDGPMNICLLYTSPSPRD